MKTINSFQFNASTKTPAPLHRTEMEIIEFCNSSFRSYYEDLAESVIQHTAEREFSTVVELGAGCAPLTRLLVADERASHLKFIICDLIPNKEAFRELEEKYPDRVEAIYEPVDFSTTRDWGEHSLLVLCAAFHHVPHAQRSEVLKALCSSGAGVMVFSPVRKTLWCMFSASLVIVPSLTLPVGFIRRPGRLRRFLWCWLVPIAPAMMVWDGVGGCLRHWDKRDWEIAEKEAQLPRHLTVRETRNSQTVIY